MDWIRQGKRRNRRPGITWKLKRDWKLQKTGRRWKKGKRISLRTTWNTFMKRKMIE